MKPRIAALLFGLTLVLRLAIAAQFRGNFDSQSFFLVADAVLKGQNVYGATNRYNYSPVWSYVVAALWRVASPNTSLFVLLVGLFANLVDVISAGVLLRLARDRLGFSPERARQAALVFFSNPVSVAVSCMHGQFDGLSILFLLLAISAAMGLAAAGRNRSVVFWLSASLLAKHVTAFHPLLFMRNRMRRNGLPASLVVVPYFVFLLSFVPFLPQKSGIIENVFLYPTWLLGAKRQRPGGLRWLIEFPRFSDPMFLVIFAAALGVVLWRLRGVDLPRACLILSLTLLVFLPGFSAQYLLWPIALGSLGAGAAYAVFSGVGAVFYFTEAIPWSWPVSANALATWVAALIWWISEMRSARFHILVDAPSDLEPPGAAA